MPRSTKRTVLRLTAIVFGQGLRRTLMLPWYILRGLWFTLLFVLRKLRNKVWAYYQGIMNAYRLGLIVLLLKVLRKFASIATTGIETFIFAFGRARDLTFPSTVSQPLFFLVSGSPISLRNFFVEIVSRSAYWAVQEIKAGNFDAFDDLEDVTPSEDALPRRKQRLQAHRSSNVHYHLEISVLATGGPMDIGLLQQLTQLVPISDRSANIKDFSLYFSEKEMEEDAPFSIAREFEKPRGDRILDLRDLEKFPPALVTRHFVYGSGRHVVPPGTAIARASHTLSRFMTYTQIFMVNLPVPADTTIESVVNEWWILFDEITRHSPQPVVLLANSLNGPGYMVHNDLKAVVPTCTLGLGLLETMFLIDQIEVYIGAFDLFGAYATGRGVPTIMFPCAGETSLPDMLEEDVGLDICTQYTLADGKRCLLNEEHQLLMLDEIEPVRVAEMFRAGISSEYRWLSNTSHVAATHQVEPDDPTEVESQCA